MLLRVIDFETTGMPPDAVVCEVGWCDLRTYDSDPAEIGDPVGMLVNPNRPIPPEARAIHHISDADLVGAPPITTGFLALSKGAPDIFVAHNAKFEQEFFTSGETPWICTMKVARRIWPECPSHTNQCLRYWLGIECDEALAMPPHRAAPDAFVTAHILYEMIRHASFDQMIEWTARPSLLPGNIKFGTKHKGQPWSKADASYLEWIINKSDMDADTKFTAKHWLEQKRRQS